MEGALGIIASETGVNPSSKNLKKNQSSKDKQKITSNIKQNQQSAVNSPDSGAWCDDQPLDIDSESSFPSLGQSSRTGPMRTRALDRTALARVRDCVHYSIEFPRNKWSNVTFATNSKSSIRYGLDAIRAMSENVLTGKTEKIHVLLSSTEYQSIDQDFIGAWERDEKIKIINYEVEDGAKFLSSSTSGVISVFSSIPNQMVSSSAMIIMHDLISLLKSESSIRDMVINALATHPSLLPGFSSINHKPGSVTFFEKHLELIDTHSAMHGVNPVNTMSYHLMSAKNNDGESAKCPIHPDVAFVALEPTTTKLSYFNKDGHTTGLYCRLTQPPKEDCIYCMSMKLAMSEGYPMTLKPSAPVQAQAILMSLVRLVMNIGYMRAGSIVPVEAARTTDHATVVNKICDSINSHHNAARFGISTTTLSINNRPRRVISLCGRSEEQRSLINLIQFWFYGDLNEWGYNGMVLVSGNSEVMLFTSGLSDFSSHLVCAGISSKTWQTASGIDNLIEFKTVSKPMHNEYLIDVFESSLSKMFEQMVNARLPKDEKIRVTKNNGDARFNFKTLNPKKTYLAIKESFEDSDCVGDALFRAMIALSSHPALSKCRDITDFSTSFAIKMKLKPMTEDMKAERKKLSNTKSLVKKGGSGQSSLPITINECPVAILSNSFSLNLAKLRELKEKHEGVCEEIKPKMDAKAVSESVEAKMEEYFKPKPISSYLDSDESQEDASEREQKVDGEEEEVKKEEGNPPKIVE
nr:zinc finger protein [Homalodisca vitripennis reovirus]